MIGRLDSGLLHFWKPLKNNLLYSKKADGQPFRSVEVQKSENFHMVST